MLDLLLGAVFFLLFSPSFKTAWVLACCRYRHAPFTPSNRPPSSRSLVCPPPGHIVLPFRYDTLAVGAPFPALDDTPPICHALDTLEERGPCSLSEGSHLVAIYNDNFLSAIEFTLCAVPLEPVKRAPSCQGASDALEPYESATAHLLPCTNTPTYALYLFLSLWQVSDSDGAGTRVASMAAAAAELQDKKRSLNKLAETVVARREALIKAQEEYKACVGERAHAKHVSVRTRLHAQENCACFCAAFASRTT